MTGSGTFDPNNYVLDGSVNTAAATAGTALDGSGATNTATLAKAPLGLSVSGTYDGTTSYSTAGGATITPTGLQGGDTVTGVTLSNANVAGNGSNYVTALTGGTASLSNYTLNNSYYATAGTSQNVATLSRAPLGVAVTGVSGNLTIENGAPGSSIVSAGLVGQDVGGQIKTATIDSTTLSFVRSITSTDFNVNNYSLISNNSSGNAGQCVAGVCAGAVNGGINVGGTNSVVLTVLQPPPVAPVVVPAFSDNGVNAISPNVKPPEFGGMNYVQVRENVGSSSDASLVSTNGLQYVPVASTAVTQITSAQSKNNKSSADSDLNASKVPSNSSPLDVFVLGSGINLSATQQAVGAQQ